MNTKTLFADFRSGIVVFLVALPLCLGIALACGVPLLSGIIAGIIGGIAVTIFSESKFSVSGPAAGLTAIIIASIHELGSFEIFLSAIILAGAAQVCFGLVRAGGIGNYIPNSVIKGMLAGIGIILIIKQIPHLVGYDLDPEGDMEFWQPDGHNSLSDLFYMINYVTPGSVIIGLLSFIILYVTGRPFYQNNKLLSFIPGPLFIVLFGILLNCAFSNSPFLKIADLHLVNLPSIRSFNDLNNNLVMPDYSMMSTQAFWIIVITLALVASVETLLNIEATTRLDPEKQSVNPNRELMAQGIGNMLSGFLGGLPVTSVIVRSSANINAGAKTKSSVIIHSILLLLCLLLIPGILGLIPNSALAVILISTGYKLTRVSLFKNAFLSGYSQFIPFIITIVVMLLTDLLKGVGAGMCAAIFFIVKDNLRPIDTYKEMIEGKLHYFVRLPQHLTFLNKGFMKDFFARIPDKSVVIIDGSINKTTDKDVKEAMLDFYETAQKKQIQIELVKYQLAK